MTILLKKSSVADKTPLTTDLQYGEVALNYNDGNLFFKNALNTIQKFQTNRSPTTHIIYKIGDPPFVGSPAGTKVVYTLTDKEFDNATFDLERGGVLEDVPAQNDIDFVFPAGQARLLVIDNENPASNNYVIRCYVNGQLVNPLTPAVVIRNSMRVLLYSNGTYVEEITDANRAPNGHATFFLDSARMIATGGASVILTNTEFDNATFYIEPGTLPAQNNVTFVTPNGVPGIFIVDNQNPTSNPYEIRFRVNNALDPIGVKVPNGFTMLLYSSGTHIEGLTNETVGHIAFNVTTNARFYSDAIHSDAVVTLTNTEFNNATYDIEGLSLLNDVTIVIPNDIPRIFVIDNETSYQVESVATSGSTTTLVDTTKTWVVNEFANHKLEILTGALAGIRIPVISNTANTLTFATQAFSIAAGDKYELGFHLYIKTAAQIGSIKVPNNSRFLLYSNGVHVEGISAIYRTGATGVMTFNGRIGEVFPSPTDYPPDFIGALSKAGGTVTGGFTMTGGGTAINLNGVGSNLITWNNDGLGIPTFNTRSVGTKLVLKPGITAASVDYALGIETNVLWSTVPQNSSTYAFEWYGGQTNIATLQGDGVLTLTNTVATTGVKLNTVTPYVVVNPGEIGWDAGEGTADLQLLNGVTLQMGQELHIYGKAVGAIANGDVVMFAGAQGNFIKFAKADVTAVGFNESWIVGIATQAFANNDFGYVTWFGKVNQLNTTAWAEGTVLYLSNTTAGALTSTVPVAPQYKIRMAAVLRQHVTQGTLMVRPDTGYKLNELHDVYTNGLANKQLLQYNLSNARWENVTDVSLAGNLVIDGNFTVNGLTTTIDAQNLSVADNMIYLNAPIPATITNAVGSGTAVVYTATNSYTAGQAVTVTGVNPTQYNVTNATITAANATSFTIASTATGAYVSGGTAEAKSGANPDIGFAGGYDDGTYHHTGLFRDATDGVYKFFQGYIPEPDVSIYIDTADASFALAPLQVSTVNSLSLSPIASGFTIAGGTTSKTLTVSNTLTLAGTDSTTMTFPSTSASIARVDAGQTFAGNNVFSGLVTGNSFIPTSATLPTNGLFLPATNTIGLATNSLERVRIDSVGNVGIGTNNPGFKLEVNGSFAATTKSFVIKHPTKENMKLRYGSLEGPENGVYCRGRLKGEKYIMLPDYWEGLVDLNTITVSLTPIGKHQKLYVSAIVDLAIEIGNDNLFSKDIDCYYTVFAERKDCEKLVVEYAI